MSNDIDVTGKYEVMFDPNVPEGTSPIRILEGKFRNFVYRYDTVAMEEHKDGNSLNVQYNYTLIEVPTSYNVVNEEAEKSEFENFIGDIVYDIIVNTDKVKETNVDDVPVEGLVPFDGEFLAKPYSYFDIVNRGSKLNFTGNSLFYKASVQIGNYPYFYQIEQRLQGKSSKAEVKDLVVKGNKGKRGPADAQTGNVPMPQFKALVHDYTGEDYDHNIPAIGTKIDEEYWSDYLETIYNQAKGDFDFGKFTIFGKTKTPKEFMEFAVRLDNLSDKKIKILYKMNKNAFSAKLRNKLRHLRTIKAILKAQKKNKLSEFLMVVYFRAAKMNITDKDLVSPFLKVSS